MKILGKKVKVKVVLKVVMTENGEIGIMGDEEILGDTIKYNELMSKIFYAMANWWRNKRSSIITPKKLIVNWMF